LTIAIVAIEEILSYDLSYKILDEDEEKKSIAIVLVKKFYRIFFLVVSINMLVGTCFSVLDKSEYVWFLLMVDHLFPLRANPYGEHTQGTQGECCYGLCCSTLW
jgi:hypothetical protein